MSITGQRQTFFFSSKHRHSLLKPGSSFVMPIIVNLVALAKQGDNPLRSVCLSVCLSAQQNAITPQFGDNSQSEKCVSECVCN